jgi:hypothetical protein
VQLFLISRGRLFLKTPFFEICPVLEFSLANLQISALNPFLLCIFLHFSFPKSLWHLTWWDRLPTCLSDE